MMFLVGFFLGMITMGAIFLGMLEYAEYKYGPIQRPGVDRTEHDG